MCYINIYTNVHKPEQLLQLIPWPILCRRFVRLRRHGAHLVKVAIIERLAEHGPEQRHAAQVRVDGTAGHADGALLVQHDEMGTGGAAVFAKQEDWTLFTLNIIIQHSLVHDKHQIAGKRVDLTDAPRSPIGVVLVVRGVREWSVVAIQSQMGEHF